MIAEKLIELRTAKGWSQEDLAKKTRISRISISRYENGIKPFKKNLKKLLDAFGLPSNYFYKLSIDNSTRKHSENTALNNSIEDLLKLPEHEQKIVISVIQSIKGDISPRKRKRVKRSQPVSKLKVSKIRKLTKTSQVSRS